MKWHLSSDDAERVESLLANLLGGYYDGFATYMTTPSQHGHEWRFGGVLGFGGKLHLSAGRVYVSAYPEDLTPENRNLIEAINDRLRKFVRVVEVKA